MDKRYVSEMCGLNMRERNDIEILECELRKIKPFKKLESIEIEHFERLIKKVIEKGEVQTSYIHMDGQSGPKLIYTAFIDRVSNLKPLATVGGESLYEVMAKLSIVLYHIHTEGIRK